MTKLRNVTVGILALMLVLFALPVSTAFAAAPEDDSAEEVKYAATVAAAETPAEETTEAPETGDSDNLLMWGAWIFMLLAVALSAWIIKHTDGTEEVYNYYWDEY